MRLIGNIEGYPDNRTRGINTDYGAVLGLKHRGERLNTIAFTLSNGEIYLD
ncbi:MAG: hypothetical protein OSA45_06785 [Halioglobus sp.]|jgi:hypothetical protein|nr:hypothetical protein [Halioglobus sp.]